MDRSLDEIVSERHRGSGGRGRRGGGGRRNERNDYPRDGIRKVHPPPLVLLTPLRDLDLANPNYSKQSSYREDSRNIDSDWVHDKFDDKPGRQPVRAERRYSPEPAYDAPSSKLRVENLHYDLTEEDLDDLFNRIGPVHKLSLVYDRAGRSEGVAYVTYESAQDAKLAVREFDGANAKGQPIRLTAVPSGPARGRPRNPFDSAGPARSLADRITIAPGVRSRSMSPIRHSNVNGPAPANVDRYVPGNRRSRSPARRERREGGRRPGARRERGDRGGGRGVGERLARDGRPKKTQEELDAEMEDYWGAKEKEAAGPEVSAEIAQPQDDVDMIE